MVAGVAAQVAVGDAVAGEDDENPAQLPRVPLDAGLAKAAAQRPQGGASGAGSDGGGHATLRTERTVARPRGVGVDRAAGRVRGAEVARLRGRPVADEDELRAQPLDRPPLTAQLRGLLSAEESPVVAEPDGQGGAVRPELAGAHRAAF